MRGAAVLVVVVSALLTACSGSDGDDQEASAPDRDERSWDAIDPCTLLSADALMAAGVQDATGVREAPPDPPDRPVGFPGSPGPLCHWGERFDETTAYVEVSLWDPPFRDLFDEYRAFEVAGRPAYSADDEDNQFNCMVDVDNGDYFVHVTVERASGDGVLACEVAASLASTAVSAIE